MSSPPDGSQLVLFCGSRKWPALDDGMIRKRIAQMPRGTTIIHGGAPGADYWSGFWARQHDYPVRVYKADWGRYGKAAGPRRNREMLDAGPAFVVAFLDDTACRGTKNTIAEAQRRGIPVEINRLR
jgi:YspA, cpYpsA-related SLOG family